LELSLANFSELRKAEVRRIILLRTLVNEECNGLPCIPLDDQGEAVAEAVAEAETVAVVAGTVCSGAGTGFSTVTVRADGAGGAASSRLLPMRPRTNPKSSATAHTTNTSTTNLAGPAFLLPWITLLLPILLSLHSSSRTHTCCSLVVRHFRAPKQGPRRVATLRTSYMGPCLAPIDMPRERALIRAAGIISVLCTSGYVPSILYIRSPAA
jgi:hypothetical protein